MGRPGGYPSPHFRTCTFPGRCQHGHSVVQRSAAIDPSDRRRYRSAPAPVGRQPEIGTIPLGGGSCVVTLSRCSRYVSFCQWLLLPMSRMPVARSRGPCDAAKCASACRNQNLRGERLPVGKMPVRLRGQGLLLRPATASPLCPIAALLAEAVIHQEEEEQCCNQAKACEKCPCSGTTAASDAPCCKVSDSAVAACDDACDEDEDDCPNTETAARVQHLMQAAEHLAAAGLEEEADEIRRYAESLRGKLLEEKLAQLARLQAEIRQLQGAAAAHQQVKIHVEIVELSLTKLRQLGFDVQSLDPNKAALRKAAVAKAADERPRVTLQVCDSAEITQLFEAFRRENILKVLASPTLITSDRRPVSFTSGGEVPTAIVRPDKSRDVHFRSVGTQVDALATLLGGDRVRLDIRPRYCEVDPVTERQDGRRVDGARLPRTRSRHRLRNASRSNGRHRRTNPGADQPGQPRPDGRTAGPAQRGADPVPGDARVGQRAPQPAPQRGAPHDVRAE